MNLAYNTATEKVTLLLNLIAYLHKHGATPVEQLAAHFRTTPEQIRHMATFIGTAGLPGDTGAYSHEDLYDINWDALERDDIAEITHVVGVDATPRFTSMQATALLTGLQSLMPLLPAEHIPVAAAAAAKLRAASTLEGASLSIDDTGEDLTDRLREISDAIHHQVQLSFAYLDREGARSMRILDPHRLMQLQGAWYVEGWCHSRKAMRTFRVEFMHDMRVTGTTQMMPAPPTTRTHIDVDSARGTVVELLVHPDVLYRLSSWKPKRVGKGTRGRIRVTVTLIHESRVIALVSQAPGQIEVVSPASARTLVADWASSLTVSTSAGDVQPGEQQDSVHLAGGGK